MEVDPVHVLQLSSQSSGVPLTSQKEVLWSARVYRDPETISDLDLPRSNLTWIWDWVRSSADSSSSQSWQSQIVNRTLCYLSLKDIHDTLT